MFLSTTCDDFFDEIVSLYKALVTHALFGSYFNCIDIYEGPIR